MILFGKLFLYRTLTELFHIEGYIFGSFTNRNDQYVSTKRFAVCLDCLIRTVAEILPIY